jgi:hypothetical protein
MEDELATFHDEFIVFKESIVQRMESKLEEVNRIKSDLAYQLQTASTGGEFIFLLFLIFLLYFFFFSALLNQMATINNQTISQIN